MKSVCPLLSCISVSRAISFFLPSAYLINQVTRFLKTKNEGSKGRKKAVVQVLGTCCKAHTSHITVLMVLAGSLHPLFYGRVPAYCHVLTLISPPSIFLLFFLPPTWNSEQLSTTAGCWICVLLLKVLL